MRQTDGRSREGGGVRGGFQTNSTLSSHPGVEPPGTVLLFERLAAWLLGSLTFLAGILVAASSKTHMDTFGLSLTTESVASALMGVSTLLFAVALWLTFAQPSLLGETGSTKLGTRSPRGPELPETS